MDSVIKKINEIIDEMESTVSKGFIGDMEELKRMINNSNLGDCEECELAGFCDDYM